MYRLRFPIICDERGALTPLMLVLLIGILVSSGIALDLMRHESERSDLQDALDRGVLAAASLTQTIDAETTIRDYLDNRSLSHVELHYSQDANDGRDSRRIAASATYNMDTIFFRLVGLKQLPVTARSAAAHVRQPVETSLALDISGTMRYDQRLINLQPAANSFIDAVMPEGSDPFTSVNLIPYAGQVNPGPVVFDLLGGVRKHNHSSCPEFTAADFDGPGLPSAKSYAQVPHFHHWEIDRAWMDWGWCPSDETAITYVSNEPDTLHEKINSIRLHDGTGTYNAMKWALALLDPSAQPLIASLASNGTVDRDFANRPAPWDDPSTLKFIVLMTDGQITEQNRPKNPNDPRLDDHEVLEYKIPHSQTVNRGLGLNYFYGLC
ncbi:MAG: pilus assembly protein, partial [Candidatus Zixiibacteriota bacterium]